MKTLFTPLTFLLLLNSSSFAQSINKTEPQQFWDANIRNIISYDIDAVVEQSHFPMTTFEGEWSKKEFKDAFDILFDGEAISVLDLMTYRDIQPLEDGPNNVIYVVVITTETEYEGEVYESSTILSFQKYEGEWKLFQIDMAG